MTQLPGYQPGKSIDDVRDIAKTSAIIKVGSNENVLGPSPKAIKAASRAAAEAHLYPANQETVLIEELIKQLGNTLTVDHFTTGNGSSDVIRQIVNAFIHKGDNIIICKPTFAIYEIYTNMRGGETLNVAHDKFKTHFEGMRKAVNSKTRLVFVCNPNNPTGLVVTHDELKRFMDTLPEHVVTVLDGAYYEFSEHPDMPRELELIEAGYNLISTRTFSKLYGLAGFRIGYGFGQAHLMSKVRAEKLHFNTSHVSYSAAIAALEDREHVEASLAMNKEAKARYAQAFDEIGISYFPTESNFILCYDFPFDAAELCDEAMKKGIILRHGDVWDIPDMVRITLAQEHENQAVIDFIQSFISVNQ